MIEIVILLTAMVLVAGVIAVALAVNAMAALLLRLILALWKWIDRD